MDLKKGSELSLSQLTEAWNLAYAGYFVPIYFSEVQMSQWLEAGSFDLERSLILMDGLSPVGLSLVGVRGWRGWIGGFGIAPLYRGRGLAHLLFQDHLNLCREEGLQQIQLEVLVENWARRVYARAGFAVTRRLSVLQGTLSQPAQDPYERSAVQEGDPRRLLAHSARLHGAHPPVWQREPASLIHSMPPITQALFTGPEAEPTGYLLFQVSPDRVRILDAAGGEAEARALVSRLGRRFPDLPVLVVNEPEGSPLHQALTERGCSEARAQWEMQWSQ